MFVSLPERWLLMFFKFLWAWRTLYVSILIFLPILCMNVWIISYFYALSFSYRDVSFDFLCQKRGEAYVHNYVVVSIMCFAWVVNLGMHCFFCVTCMHLERVLHEVKENIYIWFIIVYLCRFMDDTFIGDMLVSCVQVTSVD